MKSLAENSSQPVLTKCEKQIKAMGLALEPLTDQHIQSSSLIINREVEHKIEELQGEIYELESDNLQKMEEIIGKTNPATLVESIPLPVTRTTLPRLFE